MDINILGKIVSGTVEGIVADSNQIKDTLQNKTQLLINADIYSKLSSTGSDNIISMTIPDSFFENKNSFSFGNDVDRDENPVTLFVRFSGNVVNKTTGASESDFVLVFLYNFAGSNTTVINSDRCSAELLYTSNSKIVVENMDDYIDISYTDSSCTFKNVLYIAFSPFGDILNWP